MPFDGKSHYCDKCGKAGFKSEMAVRGHKSSCEGKSGLVREIANLAFEGGVEGAQVLVSAPAAPAPAPAPAAANVQVEMVRMQRDNARLRVALARSEKQRVTATKYATNHVPHLMGSSSGGILGQFLSPQVVTILSVLAFIWLVDVMRKDESDFKKKVVSKVGDHLIGKVFG